MCRTGPTRQRAGAGALPEVVVLEVLIVPDQSKAGRDTEAKRSPKEIEEGRWPALTVKTSAFESRDLRTGRCVCST